MISAVCSNPVDADIINLNFRCSSPVVSNTLTFHKPQWYISQVPHVSRSDYQLIDIAEDGFVSHLLQSEKICQFMLHILEVFHVKTFSVLRIHMCLHSSCIL